MYLRRITWLIIASAIFSPILAHSVSLPYEQSAEKMDLSTKVPPLLAIAMAGSRIVAVGMRGYVITSDDKGTSWRQSKVPVSSDLVAVSFASGKHGWAVGHGGVVLHTEDGGLTWAKQLSGMDSTKLSISYYEKLAAQSRNDQLKAVLEKEKAFGMDSGTPSFLGVHFQSEQVGFVVGTFNRIFKTVDGGRTWEPWIDRSDNAKYYNLYGVTEQGGTWYLTGEKGMVWHSDQASRQFVGVHTGYQGTFFGLLSYKNSNILAYGMRGTLFRSTDAGRSWDKVSVDTNYGITDGVTLSDSRIVLAYQGGGYGISDDDGKTFITRRNILPMSSFSVVPVDQSLLIFLGDKGIVTERQ